jgi:hypothetical protein
MLSYLPMNENYEVCNIHASTCVCNGLCAATALNKRLFPFGVNTEREKDIDMKFPKLPNLDVTSLNN